MPEMDCPHLILQTMPNNPLILSVAEACLLARYGVNIPQLVETGAVHVRSNRVGETADMTLVEKAYAKRPAD